MDPISNADRLVRLLRQKLEERSKTQAANRKPGAGRVEPRQPGAVRDVAAALARSGIDDEHLRRSMIEQLLADQFDPALVNEPRFQQVVDRVTEIMADDVRLRAMLDSAVQQIKVQALR